VAGAELVLAWSNYLMIKSFVILKGASRTVGLTNGDDRLMRLLLALILVLLSILLILSYGKPADQKAYEEIVATKSMEKAKTFFNNYPQTRYKDKLVNEIIEWCKQEGTESCYRMAIEVLPRDHPRHEELIKYYEKHFDYKSK